MDTFGAFGTYPAPSAGSGAVAGWLGLFAAAGLGYAVGGIKGAAGTPIAVAGSMVTVGDILIGLSMPKEMMRPQPPALAWLAWVGIPAAFAAAGGKLAYSGYKERHAQGRPLLSF